MGKRSQVAHKHQRNFSNTIQVAKSLRKFSSVNYSSVQRQLDGSINDKQDGSGAFKETAEYHERNMRDNYQMEVKLKDTI